MFVTMPSDWEIRVRDLAQPSPFDADGGEELMWIH